MSCLPLPLPEPIRALTAGKLCSESRVGLSGSRVFLFDDMVLKTSPRSGETDNEAAVCRALAGLLPVPEILCYEIADGKAFCLMTRLPGQMLCSDELMRDPALVTRLAAEAISLLQSVPAERFCGVRLDDKLRWARENTARGLADTEHADPETFGPQGFAGPAALLRWLEENRPSAERLVLTHGDLCLPNILTDGRHVTGFVDCGRMGPGDPWQDLAIIQRSLRDNFSGAYRASHRRPDYDPDALLRELGLEPDRERLRYYLLLDELF